jgi:hypothetical protein
MTYSDVTLSPDDIDWDDGRAERKWIIDAAYSQSQFELFVVEHGLPVALELFTEQHRWVANQLIRVAADDPHRSEWARHKIFRCNRLKKRRNQLRRMLAAEIGWDETQTVIDGLDARFPRAEWGTAL